MHASTFRRLVVMSMVLVILAGAVGTLSAQGGGKVLVDATLGSTDIPTLDPAINQDVSGHQVIDEIFPAPARLHETLVVPQPGMATWEVSEDGTVYTLSILPEVPWARYNPDTGAVEQVLDADGNPRYVTAGDFATTITRVMDPLLASTYGGVAAPWFVGGAEWFGSDPEASEEERQALIDALGVEVVDDYTLVLTTPSGSPVFQNILTLWFTAASPTWLIEEEGDFWIEPEVIAAYGPFVVKDWTHDESITLIKNPFWPGTDVIPQPMIDEIQFLFLENSAGFAAYEAGEVHFAVPPGSALDRVRADAALSQELSIVPGSCTYWYGVNQDHPVLSDDRVARALSYAVDRQAIIDNILRAGQLPAGFFTLPSMGAAPSQEAYPEYAMLFNPEQAQAELQAYLDETGTTAADIQFTLLHNTNETHAAIAQAVQQMWLETLGINAEIASQEWATFLDTRSTADVFRSGWCFDYPHTNNWLYDVFHSSVGPDNNFNNPAFDDLVIQAQTAPTVEERTALYAEAERILVQEDAAVIPIYYYTSVRITKPEVERTESVIGVEYYEKWDIAE